MADSEVYDQVLLFLTEPTQPICDACIEHALRHKYKTVNPICHKLHVNGIIVRETGDCVICGKSNKQVNRNA